MSIQSVLNLYKMYNTDPIHQCHLVLSKMLNNCALEMLRICDIKTTKWYTIGPIIWTLHSIRSRFIEHLHKCLDNVTTTSDGSSLGFYLKTCDGRSDMDGLFTRNGLTGMLEDAYIEKYVCSYLFLGFDGPSKKTDGFVSYNE